MRTLDTSFPLVVGAAGVGVTPGPSHWKSVTATGRVTEQVRVTESPARMGEEGEEEREIAAGSRDQQYKNNVACCMSQCKVSKCTYYCNRA